MAQTPPGRVCEGLCSTFCSQVMATAVSSLLPLAQRFLIHKHRAVYDTVNATWTREIMSCLFNALMHGAATLTG